MQSHPTFGRRLREPVASANSKGTVLVDGLQEVPQALLEVLRYLKCVGEAESLVPLIHVGRGGIVKGAFNVQENKNEALALCAQTM